MSIAVIFVMMLATAVTWPIQKLLLDPNGFGYLQTIVFILVIAALVQLVEIILKKYVPALHASLGIYLPLITTNCAVLGVTVLNIDEGYSFVESIVNAFGAAWASSWRWCCSAASVRALRIATRPSRLKDCLSLWLPPRSPRFPSWDLPVLSRISSNENRMEMKL